MIYLQPEPAEPIKQGDIFRDMPRADISLYRLIEVQEDRLVETTWQHILDKGTSNPTIAAEVKRVSSIVITQDCDALRSPDIALCEIMEFGDVIRISLPATTKAWTRLIRRESRVNLKWFYLPPDDQLGFQDRMAVNFQSVIRVSRDDLDKLKGILRVGCLNGVARKHFRERVGNFFRRYPYNEWYPFSREEYNEYVQEQSDAEDIPPYDWQK